MEIFYRIYFTTKADNVENISREGFANSSRSFQRFDIT